MLCSILLHIESGLLGAVDSRDPQRAAEAVGAGSGTGQGLPALIDGEGKIGVDKDVAILVAGSGALDSY